MAHILVINPNSNADVTRGIEVSLAGWQRHADLAIECMTLAAGPHEVDTDDDIAQVVPLLVATVQERRDVDAFVIACYCDPGLDECRSATGKPVLGMQASAVTTAIALGGRFGVLALSEASIRRHHVYLDALGVRASLAAELPLDLDVAESADPALAMPRITERGRQLVDVYGARSVVLGCAGMAAHREQAESALGVPVIEPVCAAVAMGAGLLG